MKISSGRGHPSKYLYLPTRPFFETDILLTLVPGSMADLVPLQVSVYGREYVNLNILNHGRERTFSDRFRTETFTEKPTRGASKKNNRKNFTLCVHGVP